MCLEKDKVCASIRTAAAANAMTAICQQGCREQLKNGFITDYIPFLNVATVKVTPL